MDRRPWYDGEDIDRHAQLVSNAYKIIDVPADAKDFTVDLVLTRGLDTQSAGSSIPMARR